ncbi:MAG: amylo-alpha-1,6-glucosidase [Acidobacteriota bacterium]|nr:amylo-alpha-1,6-glucosidase [Acidobacteriota bacterium]
MIRLTREVLEDLPANLSREWVETNGLGGFASSTVYGLNTRRYHGLLVAATRPPVGRLVTLAKLEETLVIDGRRYDLSVNQYPGVYHPRGYKLQTEFRLDPFPIFTYRIEGIEIEKSVFMRHGENTTVVRYRLRNAESENHQKDGDSDFILHPSSFILLELRPLVAMRDYHSLIRENGELNPQVEAQDGIVTFTPDADLLSLHFAHDADEVETGAGWYRNFEYTEEKRRGFDYHEDLYNPFTLKFDLRNRARASVIVSTERRDANRADEADEYAQAEIARRRALVASTPAGLRAEAEADELTGALVTAADQFIVRRGEGHTIIAGYPWFSDWGRDTMIALPGLTLVTNRFGAARGILSEFARHASRGMLPNRFPDAGETPDYNTVDATLWFFEAVRALLHYTNDYEFVRANLYDVLTDIIAWHVRGTRYNIHVDADGLLFAGEAGVQLTWMDAKVGDWVVTPRTGKPVEIQALWYNALRVMEELAGKFGDEAKRNEYAQMAERARASFNESFWNEEAECLFDVIDGVTRDAAIRPNQIFAVSLPYSMLSGEKARRVVAKVERDLLTPFGLRSLSPHDSQYCGRYEGDAVSRDGAYHQGTVWAWLMGPFITAYLKAHGGADKAARERAKNWLANFHTHLSEAGLGHVSEIFNGDLPHIPGGCVAQAWSVAELLRVAVEDV